MIKIVKTYQLVQLYKIGYFPMAENTKSEEINFYKPKKRFIIPIDSFHVPKKLFSEFKKTKYHFTINSDFLSVIQNCAKIRKNDSETWINQAIIDLYTELFNEGFVKSIECFYKKKLIGGLYGVHIGGCFFGESMFSLLSSTSKFCLLFLISILKFFNFHILDSQYYNKHLTQFGAYEISDQKYQKQLIKGVNKKCIFPKSFDFQKSILVLQSLSHKS